MRVQYIPLTHDHQLKLVCSTQQYANKFSLTCHTLMPNTIKKQTLYIAVILFMSQSRKSMEIIFSRLSETVRV